MRPDSLRMGNKGQRGQSRVFMIALGLALTIPGAWTGIVDGWPMGYLLMLMGGVSLGAATFCNREQLQHFNQSLRTRISGRMLSTVPGYRFRFYAFFIGLVCLGGIFAAINEMIDAWGTGQLEGFTGPKGHRVKEIVSSTLEPWRFRLNLIGDLVLTLVCSAGLIFAFRCLFLGRRAFK